MIEDETVTITLHVPKEIRTRLLKAGRVEWGATDKLTAEQHLEHLHSSLEWTANHNGTIGAVAMNGVYLEGEEIVLAHTGTSPNSPTHARILTGLWNGLHDAVAALEATHEKESKIDD